MDAGSPLHAWAALTRMASGQLSRARPRDCHHAASFAAASWQRPRLALFRGQCAGNVVTTLIRRKFELELPAGVDLRLRHVAKTLHNWNLCRLSYYVMLYYVIAYYTIVHYMIIDQPRYHADIQPYLPLKGRRRAPRRALSRGRKRY